jgi:hypothetical protein
MSTPAAPSPPRRRRRRWVIIPVGLLLLIGAATGWFYVRGTRVDTTPNNPTTPHQPVSQLYRDPEGHTTVRAAILLTQPRSVVWRQLTDFRHYDNFLPYLRDIQVEPDEEPGCTLMTGEAKSLWSGYWPFTIHLFTDKTSDEWRIWWDEQGDGEVQVNRGGWELTEPAPGRTFLVLTLQAEVRGYPNFVLRNFFLHRLRRVLRVIDNPLEESIN